MKRCDILGLIGSAALAASVFGASSLAFAADAPAPAKPAAPAATPAPAPAASAATPAPAPAKPAAATAAASPADGGPEVPPAAPGVFTATKKGANGYHLVVAGHAFTSRDAIEKYLAYRAAEVTMDQHASWFLFTQNRTKADTVAAPKRDPEGPRYSYRLAYFQPVWRYKTAASPAWKNWSPYSGAAFFADGVDPKTITGFEVSADISLRKGMMEDDNPLAYDAGAVSDFLVNQVSPPT